MLMKQLGQEALQMVKDNKVVVGIGAGIIIGGVIYTKRKKIAQTYKEMKAKTEIMKAAVKENLKEEEIFDIDPEDIKEEVKSN
ncbi:MAG: hypothetical protein ACRCW9_06110 [Cetobacterium sp.]